MTWVVIGVGVLALLWFVGGRGTGTGAAGAPAVPPGSRREELLRRATDMDDPDGTFMDGYLAGRYTERWHAARDDGRAGAAATTGSAAAVPEDDGTDRYLGADDHSDDWSASDDLHDDLHDDLDDW